MKRWAPLGAAVLLVGLTACGSGSSGTSGSAAGSSAKPAAGGDTASSAPAAGDSGGGAAGDCSKFTSPDPAKYPETPLDPRVLEVPKEIGQGKDIVIKTTPELTSVRVEAPWFGPNRTYDYAINDLMDTKEPGVHVVTKYHPQRFYGPKKDEPYCTIVTITWSPDPLRGSTPVSLGTFKAWVTPEKD
ncbi:MAG: hypothetical protein KBG77_15380 [Dermatophilaceae bacterium]|nr:hypothetical protein [Dermatophilaceae bacterium]